MGWSFPSITNPIDLVYTQSLGVLPSVALVTANPQVGNFPATGTLTLTWMASTITLPNCVVDVGSIQYDDSGRYLRIKIFDRRARWSNSEAVKGEYNTTRAGGRVRSKTLRQLATILFDAIGETTADVSALPTTVYPQVSWDNEPAIHLLDQLLTDYGYSVALGFGSEVVKVVQLGSGATLPTTNLFIASDSVDPKLVPRWIQNNFADTVIQCRLKMEPVAREDDGSWVALNSSSMMPVSGWGKVPPYTLATSKADLTEEQFAEANSYVRRAYRVMGFADGTLTRPDTLEVISGVSDILPLANRLLQTEDIRIDTAYQPFRVYGKHLKIAKQKTKPQPIGGETTDIGDLIQSRGATLDGENGILVFPEPMYYVEGGEYKPADLWIETTIRVRHQTKGAWDSYSTNVEVAPSGSGYRPTSHRERLEVIIEYDDTHTVTGSSDNQADLDAQAAAWSTVLLATYTTVNASYAVYNQPVLSLRCDGAIRQVTHIMTAGAGGDAVNRTTASRNCECERQVPSASIISAHMRASVAGYHMRQQMLNHARRRDADE